MVSSIFTSNHGPLRLIWNNWNTRWAKPKFQQLHRRRELFFGAGSTSIGDASLLNMSPIIHRTHVLIPGLPMVCLFCWFLRASTLLHVSGLITRLMQCHVRFLVMWRRESKVRERGRCFARQPPHKLNFRTTRQLNHYCTRFSCHATYNIPFFIYTN